ncbi:hypothetical protein CDV50_18885 [Haematobacter massiliensis]|uniref:Transposase n=1 Tax=Haematobacter massiliensis TaxID=195105 RepID=A0A086Y573_9RHOB|nr:hypothetical protein [Haematobacter massiliensis]KFI29423.1 hypothetical protein CN97_15990 [Haematobacter massiliensis]OWJ69272.1 hypothetical protein CDV50_18885 [Haematobacter massiliensis]OWJ83991.1 hypothetical protein CDV51_14520 [Haematobacter massiliensis]
MSVNSNAPLEAFGFSIPVTPAGRRVWPPRFKRYVLEKMDAGELTLEQITQTCGVSRSYVYQWRMQAQGKPVTAAEWRAKAQFAEVVVSEDDQPSAAAIAPLDQITVSGSRTEITLPGDYPVSDLVQIIRVLEAPDTAGVGS